MCEQCVAEAVQHGEVLPGWVLIRASRDGNLMKAGQWGLVSGNDPDYVWSATPRPEPPCQDPQWSAWSEEARHFEEALRADPPTGYLLYAAARQAGFIPEGRFAFWLFGRLGRHLSERGP
jgi:hypothetical protein